MSSTAVTLTQRRSMLGTSGAGKMPFIIAPDNFDLDCHHRIIAVQEKLRKLRTLTVTSIDSQCSPCSLFCCQIGVAKQPICPQMLLQKPNLLQSQRITTAYIVYSSLYVSVITKLNNYCYVKNAAILMSSCEWTLIKNSRKLPRMLGE